MQLVLDARSLLLVSAGSKLSKEEGLYVWNLEYYEAASVSGIDQTKRGGVGT
jgi:hypothetical protein